MIAPSVSWFRKLSEFELSLIPSIRGIKFSLLVFDPTKILFSLGILDWFGEYDFII